MAIHFSGGNYISTSFLVSQNMPKGISVSLGPLLQVKSVFHCRWYRECNSFLPFPRKCWHAYLFTKEHENRIAPILGSLLTWKCTCFCTFTLLFTFYKALCLIVLFMFTFYQPLWNVIYFHLVHFGTFKCYVHILSVTFMCYLEVKVFFTAFFLSVYESNYDPCLGSMWLIDPRIDGPIPCF